MEENKGLMSNGEGKELDGAEGRKSFEDILKDKDYQSEFDKRVAKAIETAKGKWQSETEKQLENARNEAERLARMTAEEKAKHEQEKRLKELTERENAVSRRELAAEAKNTLSEKGLPNSLAEVLDYTSAESCNKSIEAVQKAFAEAVEKAVEERLKGGGGLKKPPQDSIDGLEEEIRKNMGINY